MWDEGPVGKFICIVAGAFLVMLFLAGVSAMIYAQKSVKSSYERVK